MDFEFNEEQKLTQTMVRDFAQKELLPGFKERVKNEAIPRELIKKMAALGLLGLNIPEEYGGNQKDAVTTGVVMEEIAKYADDCSYVVFNQFSSANFVVLATEEVKKEWLPAMAQGDKIVVMGATEADAGSDLSGLKTSAKKDGDYYILNGEKNRASFAHQAHACMVLAKTDPSAKSITPFLVPFDLPGVTTARIADMGGEPVSGGIVSLEDVRIPKEYLLGDEAGKGFYAAMRNFDCIRAFLALRALAKAEISVEEAIEYSKQRVQFGRPIAKFEAVSFKLAEAATEIELGRWLCYRALWLRDQGLVHSKESAMAKWWCTRKSFNIIHECLLMHGHYGYSKDLPFEQRLRDVVGDEMGDGTPDIMKIVIAREIIGKEFRPY